MTALNHADAVYLGADPADAVYLGEELIWSAVRPLTAYRDAVLADGPLIYMRLGDPGPGALDEVAANGAVTGTLGRQLASLLPSGEGASASFPGAAGNYVLGGRNVPRRDQPYTLETWVRLPALPASPRGTVINTSQNQRTIELTIGPTGQVVLNGDSAQLITTYFLVTSGTVLLAPNQSYHLAATYSGVAETGAYRLYVNGVDVSVAGLLNAMNPTVTQPPLVGQSYNGAPLNGQAQEVALYDKALTPQRVAAHYAAAQPS